MLARPRGISKIDSSFFNNILFDTTLYQVLVDSVHFILIALGDVGRNVVLRLERVVYLLLAVAQPLHLVDRLRVQHRDAAVERLGLRAASRVLSYVPVAYFRTKACADTRPAVGRVGAEHAACSFKYAER